MEILNDFKTSIIKSFDEIDTDWWKYNGLVVAGTHNPHNVEEIIGKIREVRESKLPFLGICAGMQYAIIEFARNILDIKDATSEEFGQGTFVVRKLPKLQVGIKKTHGKNQSFWNNYAAYYKDLPNFKKYFIHSYGRNGMIDYAMLRGNRFYTLMQFHPEYQSSKERPHPILVNFLRACKKYENKSRS